jgi:hypothetical protein
VRRKNLAIKRTCGSAVQLLQGVLLRLPLVDAAQASFFANSDHFLPPVPWEKQIWRDQNALSDPVVPLVQGLQTKFNAIYKKAVETE